MNSDDLKRRTKQFALRCLRVADTLPNLPSGRTIANQMARSATSVAANYRSACRGRSKAEFVSKLGIVEEEVDETAFWLEMLIESGLKTPGELGMLRDEADQLTRIVTSSIITARSSIRNPQSKIRNPE